jgi:hypothetical protein
LIASVSIAALGTALIQSSFPSDSPMNLEKNGCIPIFALYRVCDDDDDDDDDDDVCL